MLISLSMIVIWCVSIFANIDRITFVRLVSTITTKLKTRTTPQKTTTTNQNKNTKQTITYKQTNDLQTPQQNDSDNNIPLFETDYLLVLFSFVTDSVCSPTLDNYICSSSMYGKDFTWGGSCFSDEAGGAGGGGVQDKKGTIAL